MSRFSFNNLGACFFFIALLLAARPAEAQLAFQLRTGNSANNTQSLTADSNKCASEGPRAMYVGGLVSNSSGSRIDNITATITGLNANVYLAGGQPAAQAIGSLDSGDSVGVYWFVGFGCAHGTSVTPTIQLTSSSANASTPLTLTIRSAISANAGGNVLSSVLGPGAVVGQTVYFDAAYDFGGTAADDEYFLQPAGGQNFNAACFRLVGSEVRASNIAAAPVGAKDRLYFIQPTTQSGNGYGITVRYAFQYLCAATSTVARPYAVQTSGNTNIKYTGNYDGAGSISITYPGATNPFTITKSVDVPLAFTGLQTALTYTVTIQNPSSYASVISRIVDVLPAGTTFQGLVAGSDVTAANSSSLPAIGASGTLSFVGKLGQSYAIPAGGSVVLRYRVSRPSGAGSYTNSAQGWFGSAATPVAQSTFQQVAPIPLAATKTGSIVSNPVEGTTNPKAIPGSLVNYVIQLENPNPLPIDADTIVVSDRTPSNMKLCLADIGSSGAGPVQFSDGQSPSALVYAYGGLSSLTDRLDFSNDGGSTWTYLPVSDADGCDQNVTHVRVRPTGSFAAMGRFSLQLRYRLR